MTEKERKLPFPPFSAMIDVADSSKSLGKFPLMKSENGKPSTAALFTKLSVPRALTSLNISPVLDGHVVVDKPCNWRRRLTCLNRTHSAFWRNPFSFSLSSTTPLFFNFTSGKQVWVLTAVCTKQEVLLVSEAFKGRATFFHLSNSPSTLHARPPTRAVRVKKFTPFRV